MKLYYFVLLVLAVVVKCNLFNRVLSKSIQRAMFEQDVEDVNSIHKIDNHLVRRLIVMPLTDSFKPHQGDLMHGKIQYGDKCSLPTSVGRLIFEKRFEVPWLFEIKSVKNSFSTQNVIDKPNGLVEQEKFLTKAYVSPLDFRSPENYIFLPKWLMNDLNVSARDLVDISFVRIKLASLVVLQPLSIEWDTLMGQSGVDPKVLLEHEINKYSSLTAGSTIYIEIKGVEYPLFVKETIAEGGVSVKGVRVQDSDIRTDIDRSILDKLIKRNIEAQQS